VRVAAPHGRCATLVRWRSPPARRSCASGCVLGQDPPADLAARGVRETLAWAQAHWDPGRFRDLRQVYIKDP